MSDRLLHEHGKKGMHDQVRPVAIGRGGKKDDASEIDLFLEDKGRSATGKGKTYRGVGIRENLERFSEA